MCSLHLRLQRLELLAQKFEHKASKLDTWNTGKDQPLIRTDDIDQANLAEVMVSSLIIPHSPLHSHHYIVPLGP